MKRAVIAILFIATTANAQSIASTPKGIVVAHDRVFELIGGWRVDGVAHPGTIVVGTDRVAVLDPLNDEAVIVVNGVATRARTGATPLDGVFIGNDLYVLDRDARTVERIGGPSVAVAADPAFLREANGKLYVYSRAAGVLQEITTTPFAVARGINIAPFASALALDGNEAYLVYPREGKIRYVALATMKVDGEVKAGAVPTDIAISGKTLAVADPSAKRVWVIEGKESFAQGFARGFLRGFLGLGLGSRRNSDFPTGVDRVFVRGDVWLAYDTSSATLYRFTKQSKSSVVAQNIASHGFTVDRDGIRVWDEAVRRLQRFPVNE